MCKKHFCVSFLNKYYNIFSYFFFLGNITMEKIFTNPGYNHISEKILKYLDYDTLISLKSYFDSKSTFSYLDYPRFWLKKCQQKNI